MFVCAICVEKKMCLCCYCVLLVRDQYGPIVDVVGGVVVCLFGIRFVLIVQSQIAVSLPEHDIRSAHPDDEDRLFSSRKLLYTLFTQNKTLCFMFRCSHCH